MSEKCELPGCIIKHGVHHPPHVRVCDVVTTDVQPDNTYQTIITYEIVEEDDGEEAQDTPGD